MSLWHLFGGCVTHRRCLQKNTLFTIAEVLLLKRKLREGRKGSGNWCFKCVRFKGHGSIKCLSVTEFCSIFKADGVTYSTFSDMFWCTGEIICLSSGYLCETLPLLQFFSKVYEVRKWLLELSFLSSHSPVLVSRFVSIQVLPSSSQISDIWH